MKERVSATVDEETRDIIDRIMKAGKFRNISHVIEEAIKFMGEKYAKSKK